MEPLLAFWKVYTLPDANKHFDQDYFRTGISSPIPEFYVQSLIIIRMQILLDHDCR